MFRNTYTVRTHSAVHTISDIYEIYQMYVCNGALYVWHSYNAPLHTYICIHLYQIFYMLYSVIAKWPPAAVLAVQAVGMTLPPLPFKYSSAALTYDITLYQSLHARTVTCQRNTLRSRIQHFTFESHTHSVHPRCPPAPVWVSVLIMD